MRNVLRVLVVTTLAAYCASAVLPEGIQANSFEEHIEKYASFLSAQAKEAYLQLRGQKLQQQQQGQQPEQQQQQQQQNEQEEEVLEQVEEVDPEDPDALDEELEDAKRAQNAHHKSSRAVKDEGIREYYSTTAAPRRNYKFKNPEQPAEYGSLVEGNDRILYFEISGEEDAGEKPARSVEEETPEEQEEAEEEAPEFEEEAQDDAEEEDEQVDEEMYDLAMDAEILMEPEGDEESEMDNNQ